MVVVAYLSSSASGREVGWGGRLFEAGRLLTFSAFRMGAYSRWALIRGWALIRINTVCPSEDGLDKHKHGHKEYHNPVFILQVCLCTYDIQPSSLLTHKLLMFKLILVLRLLLCLCLGLSLYP